ncbi:MAG TPA: S26 family signal peptidase [Sphingomicrobium sp.]|nr:S26 family signal peptidase [Sphingomicrobium sp.]
MAGKRSRGRPSIAAAGGLGVLALGATLAWRPAPALVWNASPSSPIGLYAVASPARLRTGETAIAWPPHEARRLAARRHYLPAGVPLVKAVAATAGARVCARGRTIFVNGRAAAVRLARDRAGRVLPWWSGCRILRRGELFLLAPGVAEAFDGRYFGVTRSSQVVGAAKLLWPR